MAIKHDELIRNDDVGEPLADLQREIVRETLGRVETIRGLVQARCPELSVKDLELAFGGASDVLAEISDAVADAIEALEERLDRIERGLPGRVQ